jgi:aminomethyltransferase
MVDFAGWSMPVQYGSIVEEHKATRTAVGLFDISHMGRLRFDGPGAVAFLDQLVTRSVAKLKAGQIRYAVMTNEAGGILDDVLVYHLVGQGGQAYSLLVVNAGNRSKIVEWINAHRDLGRDFTMEDMTHAWAMIAVQGPRALALAQPAFQVDLGSMKYYTGVETRAAGHTMIVSRTGYTGEDGVELIVPAGIAPAVWADLVERGAAVGGRPAGLGARDTLRLEAAMPLYGHELSESMDPFRAGIEFAVEMSKGPFIGRDALVKIRGTPPTEKRVGLEMLSRRVAREGYAIVCGTEGVGRVTSGTHSPTLDRPIAMGYVRADVATTVREVAVDIRGRPEPARIVDLPFYRRS